MSATIEFDGQPLIFDGKDDDQFVNEKIINLRKMRDDYQNEIDKVSRNLKYLQDKRDNIQNEIDEEFLKQEHAYDLVGKYIQCGVDEIYFVTGVKRLFDGVKILSNWYCYPKDKLCYTSVTQKGLRIISFESLDAILSGKDENFKFIPKEEALEIFNQIIEENNKIYEK